VQGVRCTNWANFTASKKTLFRSRAQKWPQIRSLIRRAAVAGAWHAYARTHTNACTHTQTHPRDHDILFNFQTILTFYVYIHSVSCSCVHNFFPNSFVGYLYLATQALASARAHNCTCGTSNIHTQSWEATAARVAGDVKFLLHPPPLHTQTQTHTHLHPYTYSSPSDSTTPDHLQEGGGWPPPGKKTHRTYYAFRSFPANQPLIIELFCGKRPAKIKRPVGLGDADIYIYVCIYIYLYI